MPFLGFGFIRLQDSRYRFWAPLQKSPDPSCSITSVAWSHLGPAFGYFFSQSDLAGYSARL